MFVSVFDLFKIGIGPSSSHTVGPMRAARTFVLRLEREKLLGHVLRVVCQLYGSLAATGKGHGSDKAVLLGLLGHEPDTVDIDKVPNYLESIRLEGQIALLGAHPIAFNETRDLMFLRRETLPLHSNGMRLIALDIQDNEVLGKVYYSVGGGFVVEATGEASLQASELAPTVPHPFRSADELLSMTLREDCSIAQIMRRNERFWRSDTDTDAGLLRIWQAMQDCVSRGCRTEGVLPGGFKVRRRAPALYATLTNDARELGDDPLQVMDWVNLYALAVNEENAAGGRVVTAPTNGAAGIVPAVLQYYARFIKGANERGVIDFLLTAAAIGILYKENASISGAEVGCQGEVGVACSMAAGALASVLGGTPAQVENAAEIGMEHHLGLTCDPVGGLVQIPCIERNALRGDGENHVSLDKVIKTMRDTGADMKIKYKETARGGLAVNIVEC